MIQQAAFLFDLDDTLVPTGYESWLACADLVNVFLISKGVKEPYSPEELARICVGIPLETFLKDKAKECRFSISPGELNYLNSTAEQLVLDHFRLNLRPIEAVTNALSLVRQEGHVIGVVSSSSLQWIELCLDAANISDFVNRQYIFSARSLNLEAKPSPAVYLEALKRMPKELTVVAVEDSEAGVRSAKAAGVQSVIGCVAFSPPAGRFRAAATLSKLGATMVFSVWDDFESVAEEVLWSAAAPYPSTIAISTFAV